LTFINKLSTAGHTVKMFRCYSDICDCLETVYQLTLLPNYTAVQYCYTNRELCEVLSRCLSLGGRHDGDWANGWCWTEVRFIFIPIPVPLYSAPHTYTHTYTHTNTHTYTPYPELLNGHIYQDFII